MPITLRAGVIAREGDVLTYGIGGWEPQPPGARDHSALFVHTDSITRVIMGPYQSPDFVSGSAGWAFKPDGSLEANDITARGTITAIAGEIGGWTIATGHLYAGSGANRVGLKPGTYPFYAGAEAEASAPFRVSAGGEVWATNAHITGEIDANSGHIGTLDIDGVLTVGTGTPVIQIDGPNKRIRTNDFTSGQKGWEITHEGNAEFNNLFVRGELHACVFVADEIQATGGTLAVMTASKVAEPISANDNKLPAYIGATFILVVQASWDTGACYVANHHVLRLKTMAEVAAGGSLDLWDIWAQVAFAPTSNGDRDLANGEPGTYDVTCVWRQGGEVDLVIPTGAAAIHWGTSAVEEGGLILTSDLNYGPYMDIFTIPDATPWSSGTTPHVRVGNLDGVLGLAEEWGIAAGKDLSDAAEPHIVMSNQRLRLWGVEQRWWDTSGNIRGEIDPSAGSSDVLFWLGPSEAGAHFKVLGSGDVWLDTLAISDDLGKFLFSRADGLLLLGPNCEISDSGWWSLRRQKATITGAFHQEAGRWLGTRGLMVEAWGTNKVKNSTFGGSVLTSWSAIPAATISAETDYPYICDACMKIVAPTDYDGARTTFTLVPATTYHLSLYMRSDSNISVTVQLRDEDAGADNKREVKTLVAGQGWKLYEYSFTTHAVNTHYSLQLWATLGHSGTWYVDAVQVEARGYRTSITSGDLAWCTWTGTAHASDSSRTATTVSVPTDGALEIANGSVALWIHIDGEPDVYRTYLSYADAGNNNRSQFYYDQIQNKYYFRTADNAGNATMIGTQAALGDGWHHIVCTWDVASTTMKLYIDGVLDASSTSANLPSVLQATLHIGSWKGTTQWSEAGIGEFATLGKVLSATEVAAMYTLQRPLADAGAAGRPGIYILDGAFKMASSFTGSRIEIDADEIAGYNSAGVKQFYLRASDGAAMAGGGNVVLDSTGLRMYSDSAAGLSSTLRFVREDSGSVYRMGRTYCGWGGGASPCIHWVTAERNTGDPWPAGIQVVLIAQDNIVGTDVRIAVNSSKVVDVTGEEIFKTEKLLRPGTGTSDPTAQLEDGCLFYRTDTDKLRLRANGAWVNLN